MISEAIFNHIAFSYIILPRSTYLGGPIWINLIFWKSIWRSAAGSVPFWAQNNDHMLLLGSKTQRDSTIRLLFKAASNLRLTASTTATLNAMT